MPEHGKVTTLVKVRTPGPHAGESGFEGKGTWLQGLQTSDYTGDHFEPQHQKVCQLFA